MHTCAYEPRAYIHTPTHTYTVYIHTYILAPSTAGHKRYVAHRKYSCTHVYTQNTYLHTRTPSLHTHTYIHIYIHRVLKGTSDTYPGETSAVNNQVSDASQNKTQIQTVISDSDSDSGND